MVSFDSKLGDDTNMISIIANIFNHPLNRGRRLKAIGRFFLWQIVSRLFKYPVLLPYTDRSSYLCWNGLAGVTGNWYNGLMEMEEMSFLVHFLRPDDCFYDVGANVGAYSILASQHGRCEVHSFEPHPQTFDSLARNIAIQKYSGNVHLHNTAIGNSDGVIRLTADHDTVNHVAEGDVKGSLLVKISSLCRMALNPPTLMKVDVEGFELQVLQGAERLLENRKLKAVIVEVNGLSKRYGVDCESVDKYLRSFGFLPYTYNPFERKVIPVVREDQFNFIYIRDLSFCLERCSAGDKMFLPNGIAV